MYYSIVHKDTGIMQGGASNFLDDLSRPVADSLAIVPLNDKLTKLLTSVDPKDHEGVIEVDYTKTYYDFSTNEWNIINSVVEFADPVENKEKERQDLLDKANVKLRIPDLPSSLRTTLTEYVNNLESIEITKENVRDVIFPLLPL